MYLGAKVYSWSTRYSDDKVQARNRSRYLVLLVTGPYSTSTYLRSGVSIIRVDSFFRLSIEKSTVDMMMTMIL